MSRVEFIAIGSELLRTRKLDTNSLWISERLHKLGLSFNRKTVVGDDLKDLVDVFKDASERCDLIIACGGLGPTFDDLTREALALAFDLELDFNETIAAEIKVLFEKLQRVPSESNMRQAKVPRGCIPLKNTNGTAPGLFYTHSIQGRKVVVVLLPGVPKELQSIWTDSVDQLLPQHLPPVNVSTRRIVIAGVPESTLNDRTRALRERYSDLDWIVLASLGHVEFLLTASDPALLNHAFQDLVELLGEDYVGEGEATVESAVLHRLAEKNHSLSVAESMTGGLLASKLTSFPGASSVFKGGIIVYSDRAKTHLGSTDEILLEAHTSISPEVTESLAHSVLDKLQTTWSISITGNAGPTVESKTAQGIGEGFICVASQSEAWVKPFKFHGQRTDIQIRATYLALDFLRRKLI